MLGIGIAATGASEPGGLRVRSVLQGGPAGLAGVRPGDVITVIDGVPIDSANALTGPADQRYPGNVIDLNWLDRAGAPHNAAVTLVVARSADRLRLTSSVLAPGPGRVWDPPPG